MGFESAIIIISLDPSIDRIGFNNDTAISKHRSRTPGHAKGTEQTLAEGTICTSEMSKSVDTIKHLGELYEAENEEHVRKWGTIMWKVKNEIIKRSAIYSNRRCLEKGH